jgi:hypothetical protein
MGNELGERGFHFEEDGGAGPGSWMDAMSYVNGLGPVWLSYRCLG